MPGSKRRLRLGTAALWLSMFASVVLLIGAVHVRSDRTNRRPVVTSEGPFAGHVTQITYAGLGLSLVALILASAAMNDDQRLLTPATFAFGIGGTNFLFTLFIYCAIYED
jgi:hypothetical protein